MKKLLIAILVITLPLITFFQYKNYKRFHPPAEYEYTISDEIDSNYHNQALIDEYFQKSVEIGAFARKVWRNDGVDVRFPDENDPSQQTQALYYNQLLARLKKMEAILKNSSNLKAKGYGNEEVKHIESGVPESMLQWINQKNEMTSLAIGSTGEGVWLLQKYLVNEGLDHEIDGVFGIDTQEALRTFQINNDLYPSGSMSDKTFQKLFIAK